MDAPVTRELLEELHEHYLTARGGHTLRPENLDDAWRWALQPVHGASSLILPTGPSDGERRFIAFDYLLDQPDNAPVPPKMWSLLIARAAPADVTHIAAEAFWRVRVSFHEAIESGVVNDVFSLASAAADKGDFAQAINLLRTEQRAHSAERRAADYDLDENHLTRSLRHQIAFYELQSGEIAAAETAFIALLSEAETELSVDDEYLQVVRHNIASCHRKRGDLGGALVLFQSILTDRERYLGPLAMNTLATRSTIALLVAQSGDIHEAIRQMRIILADENRALGSDHTNPLETRGHLVDLLAEAGDLHEAIEISQALLPDLVRALGRSHPVVCAADTRHKSLAKNRKDNDTT
jgi:tetratricopeptide (TPR) repeat protein